MAQTKAQRWASRRNGAKFRLRGMRNNLDSLCQESILSPVERDSTWACIGLLDHLLMKWEDRNQISKQTFLAGGGS
jgi:hypothetical protein